MFTPEPFLPSSKTVKRPHEPGFDGFLDRPVSFWRDMLKATGLLAVMAIAAVATVRSIETYDSLDAQTVAAASVPAAYATDAAERLEVDSGIALDIAVTSGLIAATSTTLFARRSRRYAQVYGTHMLNRDAQHDFRLSAQQGIAELVQFMESGQIPNESE